MPIRNGSLGIALWITLPTEIVIHVFECCLPTALERREVPLHHLAPLSLSWMCKSWRELVLSTPSLWSELAIGHRRTDPEADTKLMEMWIERSSELPLQLRLNYELNDAMHPVLLDREKEARYRRGMNRILAAAVGCIQRWKAFEIHTLDVSVLDQVFLALVTRGAPVLEQLAFSTKYLGFFGDMHMLDFSRCPKLQNVCMRTPMITPVNDSAVMENMTRLELRYCASVEDCLCWIDMCPVLEDLTVRLFCSTPDWPDDPLEGTGRLRLGEREKRRLAHLESVDVHNFSMKDGVGPLLDSLDLPALQRLCVNMYDMVAPPLEDPFSPLDIPQRWRCVLSLLHRSSPALETFEVLGTPMSIEEIIECLRLLPSIRHLAIGTSRNADTHILLEALTLPAYIDMDDERSIICPKLEVVDLTFCPVQALDLVAHMISSRCPDRAPGTSESVSTLKELRLDAAMASRALHHPVIRGCMRKEDQKRRDGLTIVEQGRDLLVAAFANPDVVFV